MERNYDVHTLELNTIMLRTLNYHMTNSPKTEDQMMVDAMESLRSVWQGIDPDVRRMLRVFDTMRTSVKPGTEIEQREWWKTMVRTLLDLFLTTKTELRPTTTHSIDIQKGVGLLLGAIHRLTNGETDGNDLATQWEVGARLLVPLWSSEVEVRTQQKTQPIRESPFVRRLRAEHEALVIETQTSYKDEAIGDEYDTRWNRFSSDNLPLRVPMSLQFIEDQNFISPPTSITVQGKYIYRPDYDRDEWIRES